VIAVGHNFVDEPTVVPSFSNLWIRGRVFNCNGTGAGGASVSVYSERCSGALFGRTESDGSFKIGPLAAGLHQVYAKTRAVGGSNFFEGPCSISYPVEAGRNDVVVIVE
jgi:hypothetical protein